MSADKKAVPLLFVTSLALCLFLLPTIGIGSETGKRIIMRDDCDQVTFDAMFGPGTCQGNGTTTLDRFIGQFLRTGSPPRWRFDPQSLDLPAGKHLVLENQGGEVHSWTEVAAFGAGFGFFDPPGTPLTPECLAPESINNQFVEFDEEEDGATAGSADLPKGTHKFMCCIHPWMQTVVKVNK